MYGTQKGTRKCNIFHSFDGKFYEHINMKLRLKKISLTENTTANRRKEKDNAMPYKKPI